MKFLVVLCLTCVTVYSYPYPESSQESGESDEFLFRNPFHLFRIPARDVKDDSEEDVSSPSIFFKKFFSYPSFSSPFSSFFQTSSFFPFTKLFEQPPQDFTLVNSTSSVKNVDGNRVSVKTTIYENKKTGGFYKYNVVEITGGTDGIEGEKSGEEETGVATSSRPEEGTENGTEIILTEESGPSEVSKVGETDKNDSLDNEIVREESSGKSWRNYRALPEETMARFDNYDELGGYIDLSDDIRVNDRAVPDSGSFTIPADVEILPNFDTSSILAKYDYFLPARDIYDFSHDPQAWQQPRFYPQNNFRYDYENNIQPPNYYNKYPYVNNVQYYNGQKASYAPIPTTPVYPRYNHQQKLNRY